MLTAPEGTGHNQGWRPGCSPLGPPPAGPPTGPPERTYPRCVRGLQDSWPPWRSRGAVARSGRRTPRRPRRDRSSCWSASASSQDKAIEPRPTAAADARALYKLFADPKHLNTTPERVVLLTAAPDEGERKATRENVIQALHEAVAKTGKDDTIIIGLFGRGATVGEDTAFFTADATFKERAKTALLGSDLVPDLKLARDRKVLPADGRELQGVRRRQGEAGGAQPAGRAQGRLRRGGRQRAAAAQEQGRLPVHHPQPHAADQGGPRAVRRHGARRPEGRRRRRGQPRGVRAGRQGHDRRVEQVRREAHPRAGPDARQDQRGEGVRPVRHRRGDEPLPGRAEPGGRPQGRGPAEGAGRDGPAEGRGRGGPAAPGPDAQAQVPAGTPQEVPGAGRRHARSPRTSPPRGRRSRTASSSTPRRPRSTPAR